jgi:2-aminobenzoate-CoA ligase
VTLTRSAHVDTFTRDHLPPIKTWPPLTLPPGLHYPERLNAASALLDGGIAARGPDRTAIVTPTTRWTYGELGDHVNQLAGFLVGDAGLVPGARVLLLMPNNEWLFTAWLAVLKAGCVAVTSMPALRATELQTVNEIAHVDYTLTDSRFAAEWIASGIGPGALIDEVTDRLQDYPAAFDAVDTAADDVAILAFTSGSTGRPKATMHFHRDLLAIADTFAAHVLRATPDDLFVGSPPIGFTFGLGGLLIFPMRIGGGMLLLERGTPDVLGPAIGAYGATVLFTAPTAYRALLAMPDVDFSSLRRCVSAGEPLSAATWHAFHERTGLKIIDGIGSTEMLHIFIASSDDEIRPGATGRVVPGYEARIVDGDGVEVPDGTIGRLAVRGPTGCRYLSDPRQSEYVQDGWNLTGDTYLRDADGYYWYQARNDDMIISAGFNIAGPEVEMALLSHPDVLECAVIGAADAERTMIVHAFVVTRPGTAPSVSELQAHCRRVIAPYKAPRVIDFIDALPRTTTGKVQRFRLRDRLTPPGR